MDNSQKSFTLMELLIVIAIIAILAAIVLVSLNQSKQSAWESRGMQFSQSIKTGNSTDLVGEWSFDDSTNPGRDDSGNGNNGSLLPVGSEPVLVKGKTRKALEFSNAKANYVNIPKTNTFNIIGEITLASWIRTTDNFAPIIGTMDSSLPFNGYSLLLGADGSGRVFYWPGNYPSFDWASSESAVNDGNWHYVAVTHSGTTAVFYIDGKKDSTTNNIGLRQNNSGPTTPFIIGRITFAGAVTTNGTIDEVTIYKSALTSQQIQQLYAQGKIRHFVNK